jgi:hypothetical protein
LGKTEEGWQSDKLSALLVCGIGFGSAIPQRRADDSPVARAVLDAVD